MCPLLCPHSDQHSCHPIFDPSSCGVEFCVAPEKPDLPSGQGRVLSGGAGVDRTLFPISLAPRAADNARSLRHRGYTRTVSHEPSPPGGEWPSLRYMVPHVSGSSLLKGGCFHVKMRFVNAGYIYAVSSFIRGMTEKNHREGSC